MTSGHTCLVLSLKNKEVCSLLTEETSKKDSGSSFKRAVLIETPASC